MPVTPTSLADHLLVALPSLLDATFARSVALICQHDENGAMGVLVNQPSEYTLGEVLAQMDITTGDGDLQARMVLNGGPVHPERGFVIHDDARAQRWRFAAPASLRRYIAKKGSICVDGVSLTVNEVDDDGFEVALIPHTVANTAFSATGVGSAVNLEIDLVARYVERLMGVPSNGQHPQGDAA